MRSLGRGRSRGSSIGARPSPQTSSHPKAWKRELPSPASARAPQMGEAVFRSQRGSIVLNCSARAQAAGRGHMVTRAIPPDPAPDHWSRASLLGQVASGLSGPGLTIKSGPHGVLGRPESERGAGAATQHHPSSSIPWPEASGPPAPAQPFPTSLITL